ncbi:hypothetical protein GCM10020254_86960 [Streptomyces goshikiensis]
MQRVQGEKSVLGLEGDQVLVLAHHEGGDARLVCLGQGLLQQAVDLPELLAARAEVVGLVEEDRVDLRQVDEPGDVQRPGAARCDVVEFLRLDQNVLVAGVVALDDVRQLYLVARALVDPAVADPVGGAALELVEVDGVAVGGRVEAHRQANQAE